MVPEVRTGILPTILAALMTARAATRAALKQSTDPTRRAILDSRQKAIKLIANASYGFTGAALHPQPLPKTRKERLLACLLTGG